MRRVAVVVYLVIAVLALKRVVRAGAGDVTRRVAFLLVGVAALAFALDRLGVPGWALLAGLLALLWRSGLLRWGLVELGTDPGGPWLWWGNGTVGEEPADRASDCPPDVICLGLEYERGPAVP